MEKNNNKLHKIFIKKKNLVAEENNPKWVAVGEWLEGDWGGLAIPQTALEKKRKEINKKKNFCLNKGRSKEKLIQLSSSDFTVNM